MIYNLSQYNIHWKTKRLNQLGVFSRGKSKHRPRDDYRLFINGKYPLIQTSDIKKANLYVTSHVQEYNEFGLQQSKLWNKGTLCITIAANIADTAIISYPMCFPDSVVGFLANKNESSELFMHYIFKYIQNNIKKTVRGSIQDNININYLEQLYFKIPEKAYQNKIVLILSSIDKKIELNNKINTELEAMAKTIYDYWFLQFEFPNEEGKPYKSSGGKMIWNEELKREIPEGWEVNKLEEYISVIRGVNYKRDDVLSNKEINYIPLIKSNNIQNGQILFDDIIFVPQKLVNKNQILSKNSVLMTMSSGSKEHMGKTTIIYDSLDYTFGAFCSKIEIIEDMRCFLSIFFRSALFKTLIDNITSGTNINNISNEHLYNIKMTIPNKKVLQKFEDILNPILDKQGIIQKENQELTSLRDFLLPLLMNGQVGFKEDKAEG